MFNRTAQRLADFRRTPRYPVLVVAAIGFAGFLLDYLWRPISTSGLIFLGLAVSPWLIRVIKLKKGTLAGWEFEVADTSAPATTGARLAEELADEAMIEPEQPQLPLPKPEQDAEPGEQAIAPATEEVAEQGADVPRASVAPSPDSTHEARIARVYLAEGLAFQELQREFGGFIQRDVSIGSIEIDGLIVTGSSAIAVEVKVLRDLKNWKNRVADKLYFMFSALEAAKKRYNNVRLLVAVVVDSKRTPFDVSRRLRELRMIHPEVDVRIYFLPELLDKYGVSPEI